MTWFRRVREEGQADAAPDEDDSPEALLNTQFELTHFINANAGKLPGEAVVIARRITDTVREVIDTSTEHPLDIYAIVSIRGVLDDYLPTALRGYLALDPSLVDTARPSGRTPNQSLLEQLDALWSSATDLLVATRAHDADALMTHGNFLRTKFTGSDLDL
ncbi:MAG: hypothetical protein ABI232_11795 [Jatrophihabitantaceae bacterium]